MTWLEGQAVGDMFEAGGFATSQEGAVTVLAGATLGGGTKINWCAAIRPPPHLRKEWAEQHGLTAFTSDAFEEAVEVVCARAGVNVGSKYNGQNALLKQGLEALGKHAGEYPRNCSSKECSVYCTLGCKTGHKQSTDVTWLVDAVKAGGRVVTGVMVDKLMMEEQQVRGGGREEGRAGNERGKGERSSRLRGAEGGLEGGGKGEEERERGELRGEKGWEGGAGEGGGGGRSGVEEVRWEWELQRKAECGSGWKGRAGKVGGRLGKTGTGGEEELRVQPKERGLFC